MNENPSIEHSIHWSFWIICVLALIWNGLGSINFVVQMNPEMIEGYREVERAIIEGRPIWATTGFALSVFGGTLGCGLLLLKKKIAFYAFALSMAGTLVTMVHTISLDIEFGAVEILFILLLPVVVAAFLIWYSKYSAGKGWVG